MGEDDGRATHTVICTGLMGNICMQLARLTTTVAAYPSHYRLRVPKL
jgi:hypothetical protein